LEHLEPQLRDPTRKRTFAERVLRSLFEIIRALAAHSSLRRIQGIFPAEYRELFQELLYHRSGSDAYLEAIVAALVRQERVLELIRLTVRVVRNLAIDELIIGGGFWDRGPRGDRLLDYVLRQPSVALTGVI